MTEYVLDYYTSEFEGKPIDVGIAKIHYPKLFAKWLLLIFLFAFCIAIIINLLRRI